MNFSEFITYCTLREYVTAHKELTLPDWDNDADHYFRLDLKGNGHIATIKYATIGKQCAIVSCNLFQSSSFGVKIISDPGLGDILEAFVPE